MTGDALTGEGICVTLDGARILQDVTFRAPAGAVTGLLGPNGSGKTTLISVAAGLRRPDAGEARLLGEPVRGLSRGERARRLALVEQQAATDWDLTVSQVVSLGRTPHRSRWAPAPPEDAVVSAAMAATDVTHLRARAWATLSGGERQRVHLARAVAQQPQVLLLDEPANHLDLRHQIDLMALVRGLGVSVLAALHDLELAAAFCDWLVVLDGGRVAAQGPPGDVLTRDLLGRVFSVDGQFTPHPETGRPHLVWSAGTARR